MSGSGGGGRRSFKEQVHVDGKYGKRTVRRKDDPDVGRGKVHAVLSFEGVLEYDGETYFGNISVGEESLNKVEGVVADEDSGYEVVDFVKGGDDDE